MTRSVAAAEAVPRADLARDEHRAEAGPGTAAASLLTVSGLSVSYGPLRALDDVNSGCAFTWSASCSPPSP